MPANARCIIAAIGSIPFVFGVFLIVWQVFDDYFDFSYLNNILAYAAAAVIAVPLWMIIWRRRIAWTPRVWRWTLGSAVALIALPILVLLVSSNAYRLAVLPPMGWGVWMGMTGCLWPYKPDADVRPTSPLCLACGYPLTGLTHTRCPECGD